MDDWMIDNSMRRSPADSPRVLGEEISRTNEILRRWPFLRVPLIVCRVRDAQHYSGQSMDLTNIPLGEEAARDDDAGGIKAELIDALLQIVEEQPADDVGRPIWRRIDRPRPRFPERHAEPVPLLRRQVRRGSGPFESLPLERDGRHVHHREPRITRRMLVDDEFA